MARGSLLVAARWALPLLFALFGTQAFSLGYRVWDFQSQLSDHGCQQGKTRHCNDLMNFQNNRRADAAVLVARVEWWA